MKLKQLSEDYDVTVDNMVPITTLPENINFDLMNSQFYSFVKKTFVNMDILVNEEAGWQIFAMNDNTFVLEVEDFDMGTVDYFQADNLQDILDTYEV
jgi:hypothetical protein